MATVQVNAIKGNVQNAINYIINKEKTNDLNCEAKNCNMHCAGIQWHLEYQAGKHRLSAKDDVVGYHFRQNFAPGTVTPEKAFEISKEWIEKITGGNFDYVIATHQDKKHIHTHIIVSPFNSATHKKMDLYFKRDLKLFKNLSDEICKKHGLETLEAIDYKGSSHTYYEWMIKNKGDTYKDIIKKTIDYIIPLVKDYTEFKLYLNKLGFIVEDGSESNNKRTGLRIKIPQGKKFIRCDRINFNGEYPYSLEAIKRKIENNGIFVTTPEIRELLNAENESNDLRNQFYERCNIKQNFKDTYFSQMSNYEKMLSIQRANIKKTMNELKKIDKAIYGIDHLADLKDKRNDIQAQLNKVIRQLKINEKKFEDLTKAQMDNIIKISDNQIDKFITDRIIPLQESKKELMEELKELSEIINKTEATISKTKKIQNPAKNAR